MHMQSNPENMEQVSDHSRECVSISLVIITFYVTSSHIIFFILSYFLIQLLITNRRSKNLYQ
jgi:hypothetical protein